MPHSTILITTIAVSLGLALIMGIIAQRLKLPVLVGYLLAGMIIGPYSPGFVADIELSNQLAEIGVILLMFGVGLHFSLDDLLAVRRIALPGAIAQIAVATALGATIAISWGWSIGGGIVFGLALSVASTVVLLRALEQHGQLKSINGRIAVGWLIVEDLVVVLALVLLPPLSVGLISDNSAVDGTKLVITLILTLAKVSIFIAFMLIVGKRLFPWLLWHVASTKSNELFTLCVIAVAVGIAYGAAILFDVSFALGAFFSGMVMRESSLSHRAAQESLPLRDAFSVLFFVSVGMLFDPHILIEEPLHVLIVVAIILLGKSLVAFILVLLFHYPLNTALTVSVSLAQIGELSFILASLGLTIGLLPPEGYSLILAGAFISITLNPLVFQTAEPIQNWIRTRSRLARRLERSMDPLAELPMAVESNYVTNHVVIVGYGAVGKRVSEMLAKKDIHFVVADHNREIVERLRREGIHAVAGDAVEPAVLIQAHISRASVLIITAADALRIQQMVETTHILNPQVEILISTHDAEDAARLQKENAGRVFLDEQELANNITHHVLNKLECHK
ncbi:YbaL family putative K(+) efflux transporter [Nitrosomonas communis]|uniref:Monovalent cation:H+ antiporter-2, CPA2 family n=1 Tax=Nitrosomonas communis TaxID=44574 RepID=A0A1H2SSD2_9PROT|nr:YbaL family putative K(+) efflux transporter [Nitrosomonas communis]SDW34571.1 monovalent cation:H+ antiporter-2, CPA2 family [Nitrosomonas communis]